MKTCFTVALLSGMLILTSVKVLAQWESNSEYRILKKQVQKAVVNSLRTQPDSCKMRYILLEFKLGKGQKLDSVTFVTNITTQDATLMKSKLDTLNVKWQVLLSKKQLKNSAIMMPIMVNDVSDYCRTLNISGSEMFIMLKATTEATQQRVSNKSIIFFPALEVEYSRGK